LSEINKKRETKLHSPKPAINASTFLYLNKIQNIKDRDEAPICPFYLRYQRIDGSDKNSEIFLNDWNMCHSHPVDLKIVDTYKATIAYKSMICPESQSYRPIVSTSNQRDR